MHVERNLRALWYSLDPTAKMAGTNDAVEVRRGRVAGVAWHFGVKKTQFA
jgi:hypothetical protein